MDPTDLPVLTRKSDVKLYALKWRDYGTNICSVIQQLHNEDSFVDVKIVCKGDSFMVHKVLLSASSTFFNAMLKENSCPDPVIILPDVHKHDMKSWIQFMYTGEVRVEKERLHNFLQIGKMLQIHGVTAASNQNKVNSNDNTYSKSMSSENSYTNDHLEINVSGSSESGSEIVCSVDMDTEVGNFNVSETGPFCNQSGSSPLLESMETAESMNIPDIKPEPLDTVPQIYLCHENSSESYFDETNDNTIMTSPQFMNLKAEMEKYQDYSFRGNDLEVDELTERTSFSFQDIGALPPLINNDSSSTDPVRLIQYKGIQSAAPKAKSVTPRTKGYTLEELSQAVSAVTEGRLGVRAASRMYNVPFATLQRRLTMGNPKDVRPGKKPLLDAEDEKNLVEAIKTFHEIGFELSRKEILRLAKEADNLRPENVRRFKNDIPSQMWYERFVKRNNLSLKTARNRPLAYVHTETEEIRDELFEKYSLIAKQLNLTANDIYNVDESVLQLAAKSETVCATVCGNASGTVLMPPLIIFKGMSLNSDAINAEQYPVGASFHASSSGNMVCDIFMDWMRTFVGRIPSRRPVLLLLDCHEGHISYEILNYAKNNNIQLLCFPPGTTQFYQPMEVGVLKCLKANFNDAVSKRMRELNSKLGIEEFGNVFTEAWDSSVTSKNIRDGFRYSGMWPIDKFAASNRLSSASSGGELSSSHDVSRTADSGPSFAEGELNSTHESISSIIKSILERPPQNEIQ